MMNQIKSARVQIIRFLFVLPLVAVLLLAFREVREKEKRNDPSQQTVLLKDTVPATDIKSINVNKNDGEKTITITLKNGTTETYNLNDEKEKATFEKKYGKIDKLVPPPPAPPVVIKSNNVESVNVQKNNGKNSIQIRLKDGSVETYDLNIKEQRDAVEKKYHVTTTSPEGPINIVVAPATPGHEEVKLNSKGYYLTIADNMGECVVIVKDKKKNIIEALKLTDWTANEKKYEAKYGEIPPPPPPAPAVPGKVAVATTVGSPAAVSAPASVNVTTAVSPVKGVTVVGYPTKTTATVEGKPVTGSVKSTSPSASLKEVTVVGYATGSTAAATKKPNIGIGFKNGVNADDVLYIVDGKEISYEEVGKIDPENIESISVLKGENAEKLYGAKGKNGVIIIKTKKTTTFNFFTTPWQKEKDKC